VNFFSIIMNMPSIFSIFLTLVPFLAILPLLNKFEAGLQFGHKKDEITKIKSFITKINKNCVSLHSNVRRAKVIVFFPYILVFFYNNYISNFNILKLIFILFFVVVYIFPSSFCNFVLENRKIYEKKYFLKTKYY
jgi:hypothetical protein